MTIEQALQQADEFVPNTIKKATKLFWLSELEGRLIYKPITFSYDDDTDTGTELLIPHPYDGIYIDYLAMMIALAVDDKSRYNSFLVKYQDDLSEYRAMAARTARGRRNMYYGR